MKVRRMICPRTLCHERGGGIKVFVIFFIKWHYMAKIVKITKITKTLKAPLFMFSPSRAGGSFLSHEGGEKASDGKTYSSRVTCRWKLRRLLRLQPTTRRGESSERHMTKQHRRNVEEKKTINEVAVESEEPPESGVGGRVYLLVGYSLFREHVY